MHQKEFLSFMEEIFEIDAGQLREDTLLAGLDAWDSIGVLNLIALADEKLNIILSPDALEKCKKVSDILTLCFSRAEE
ncbi:MAG: acyl carrier protein [Magnetococcus sp. YQC-5]